MSWPEPFPGADFVPVGPWNTDGLLILNPLRFPEQLQYVQQLKEQEFPVLFIGLGGGTPMIVVDNAGGIRQVMEHLVESGESLAGLPAAEPGRLPPVPRMEGCGRTRTRDPAARVTFPGAGRFLKHRCVRQSCAMHTEHALKTRADR